MKNIAKFLCRDCGKKVEGKPNLVARSDPSSGALIHVNVCHHCQYGIKPEKRSGRGTM